MKGMLDLFVLPETYTHPIKHNFKNHKFETLIYLKRRLKQCMNPVPTNDDVVFISFIDIATYFKKYILHGDITIYSLN